MPTDLPHPRCLSRLALGLIVSAAVAIGAAVPASAAEAPTTPSLTGTHPSSPGLTTTPRVFGTVSEITTSSMDPFATEEFAGGDAIEVYEGAVCAGSEVASGTISEFENSGIQVTVAAGSETTFSATHSDVNGVSACSNSISYQQVSEPPKAPIVTAVTPASPSNYNLPQVIGSADPGSSVALYTNPSCSGAAIASGSAGAFASAGIAVEVADNSTTTFFARASWAELPSACSATSVTYREVTPVTPPVEPPAENPGGGGGGTNPPATVSPTPKPVVSDPRGKPQPPQLRTAPGPIANNAIPRVTGTAPGASVVRIYSDADCKGAAVAKGSLAEFLAGLPVPILPNSTVAFYGKSVDGGGDESACSSAAVYTDDSIPPHTRITAGPPIKTIKPTVVFRFTDTTGGTETRFLCKVDRKPWKACQTPLRLKKLGHKRHLLRVKAYDAAGNREKAGTKRSFQVVRGR